MPSLLRGLLVGSYCTCLSGSPSGPSRCDATFSCKYLVTVQRPILIQPVAVQSSTPPSWMLVVVVVVAAATVPGLLIGFLLLR